MRLLAALLRQRRPGQPRRRVATAAEAGAGRFSGGARALARLSAGVRHRGDRARRGDLRRRSGRNWLREDRVELDRLEQAGEHVLRVFAAQDYLELLDDEHRLLEECFVVVERHHLEQSSRGSELQSTMLALDEGLRFRVALDVHSARARCHSWTAPARCETHSSSCRSTSSTPRCPLCAGCSSSASSSEPRNVIETPRASGGRTPAAEPAENDGPLDQERHG